MFRLGIGYTVGRVPMGSCDFSWREYSYDDPPNGVSNQDYTDFNLTNFALNYEDLNYKLPLLRMAQSQIGENLRLFTSPWSPPAWMRNNFSMTGDGGTMRGDLFNDTKYWTTWTKYFIK